MQTPIVDAIATADSQGRYLSNSELQAINGRFQRAAASMEAARVLSSRADELVRGATEAVYAKFPYTTQPGGQCHTQAGKDKCARDVRHYLRYITYAVAAGDASVLNERCLNGLRETYQALGTPGSSVANGIQKMKKAAVAVVNDPNGITRGDCSALIAEIESYFDRAAAAVV